MASERTPNLNLAIPADASAEARANLFKIDALGAAIKVDTAEDVVVRSKRNIRVLPEDSSTGGEGDGSGEIIFGESGNNATLTLYGTFNFSGAAKILDSASGGTKYLSLKYKSDAAGGIEASADRSLNFDPQGADRSLILGGNFEVATSSIKMTAPAAADFIVPATGTLATLAGAEALTNKTVDADQNTISNIADGNIKAAAAIAGTKISPNFGAQNVQTSGQFRLMGSTYYSALRAATSGQIANVLWTLPAADGAASQVLGTTGAGQLQWLSVVSGTLAQNRVDIGDASSVRTPIDTSGQGDILADTASGFTIKAGAVADAHVAAAAAIALTKLAPTTFSKALASNASGFITPATTTAAELDFLSGVTSAVQTQLNGKLSTSATTSDVAEGANLYFTAERVDDRVAALIINSNDFTWTYTDGSNTLSAALANTAITAKTSVSVAAGDSLLISDASDSDNLKKITAQSILDLAASQTSFAENWTSLATKTVTHNLGSRDVMIQLYDNTTFETVYVDSAVRTTANQVDLTASSAPTGAGWRVLIKKL